MEDSSTVIVWAPFGGRMNEISEFATPYPYRAGYIHNILYTTTWDNAQDSVKQIDSSRKFHAYMRPHVSMFPRAVYLNYKDLDLGVNKEGHFNYLSARSWGTKYFRGNFERLVYVKSMVDPGNFFRNKQSFPTY